MDAAAAQLLGFFKRHLFARVGVKIGPAPLMRLVVMDAAHGAAQAVGAHALQANPPNTHHIDAGDQHAHPHHRCID